MKYSTTFANEVSFIVQSELTQVSLDGCVSMRDIKVLRNLYHIHTFIYVLIKYCESESFVRSTENEWVHPNSEHLSVQ